LSLLTFVFLGRKKGFYTLTDARLGRVFKRFASQKIARNVRSGGKGLLANAL
jgi:hypothetical protein